MSFNLEEGCSKAEVICSNLGYLLQHILANKVQEAGEEVNQRIQSMSGENVLYIDGWYGFGASHVLRYIAAMLPSRRTIPKLCFDRTIFIDCSKWKNRRAVQRAIAMELQLEHVMAILDKQDEYDDFLGIDESSRNEIDGVAQMIDQTLSATKFIMFFLNGSDDEIDVGTLGVPLTRFGKSMVIWTFDRCCLTIHDIYGKLSCTQVYIHSLGLLRLSLFLEVLNEQSTTIVARCPGTQDINPTMVAECCLYGFFLHSNFHMATRLEWLSHASNYWICDGIIKGDRARDIVDALHGQICWQVDAYLIDRIVGYLMEHIEPRFLVVKEYDVYKEGLYRWISVTSRNMEITDLRAIPATTSSFFLTLKRSGHTSILPNGLFERSNKLGVLVLGSCAFNFASPPFRKCHNLKFLGLDHCTDDKTIEVENHIEWTFLHSLMVLDLRNTDWDEILSEEKMDLMTNITELKIEGTRCWQYIVQLKGRLPNLERLRIIKPSCQWEASIDVDNSFIDKTSMEMLDFSGNSEMKTLPTSLSDASSLQMLVLDGCDMLETVGVPSRLPSSLKYFSFDGCVPTSQRTPTVEIPHEHFSLSSADAKMDISTSKISLEGCTELDNLLLRGLINLVELDLSRTAIKILDFNTMVVQVPRLKRLFLMGCKHLRAINFSNDTSDSTSVKASLELVCIDTRAGIMCPRPSIDKAKSFLFQMHATIVDDRLINSLNRFISEDSPNDIYYNIHVTSSLVHGGVVQFEETKKRFDNDDQESLQQLIQAGQYNDVLILVGDPPMQAFPQPPATQLKRHIEIGEGGCYVESELAMELRFLMAWSAESVHLHDVLIHSTDTEGGFEWMNLRWCCVKRCPNLDSIFPSYSGGFHKLETFWASDLLMVRWIWSKGLHYFNSKNPFFQNLQHLHLQSCPRLQSVIPVWHSSFPSLETLHIIQCGVLMHVFELDRRYPAKILSLGVLFPKLTTIHLHDLPKMHQICEVKMVAPALETIKIRGCWGLRRLPSVEVRPGGAKKPTVEIEKDVWDGLEWDVDHRPDHFEAPIHSRYYKKKLPRVSFLR